MSDCGKKYRPSSGTEGCSFIDAHCYNCIHGKYEHTGNAADNPCDIISRSFLYDINDKEYPEEWQYGKDGKPTCTKWVKWDWGKDDDGNWIDPPPPPTDDPNQLVMPFIFDELGVKEVKKETV